MWWIIKSYNELYKLWIVEIEAKRTGAKWLPIGYFAKQIYMTCQ